MKNKENYRAKLSVYFLITVHLSFLLLSTAGLAIGSIGDITHHDFSVHLVVIALFTIYSFSFILHFKKESELIKWLRIGVTILAVSYCVSGILFSNPLKNYDLMLISGLLLSPSFLNLAKKLPELDLRMQNE